MQGNGSISLRYKEHVSDNGDINGAVYAVRAEAI
jgi:hypothetical protein